MSRKVYIDISSFPPLVPPSEWNALIETKELVTYSLDYVPPTPYWTLKGGEHIEPGMDIGRNLDFVLGFEATGEEPVTIFIGGQAMETIDAAEIHTNGAPTTSGFYVAFRVPLNITALAFHRVHITKVVKVRCAKFVNEKLRLAYVWSGREVIPLYKSNYRIVNGIAGKA